MTLDDSIAERGEVSIQSGYGLGASLPQADAGVEPGVEQVGGQVGQGEAQHGYQGDGLQQGQVAAVDGEDQQAPQPRVVEDVFDDDQAADQPAGADGDHGDGRQQGVAQHVAHD